MKTLEQNPEIRECARITSCEYRKLCNGKGTANIGNREIDCNLYVPKLDERKYMLKIKFI